MTVKRHWWQEKKEGGKSTATHYELTFSKLTIGGRGARSLYRILENGVFL